MNKWTEAEYREFQVRRGMIPKRNKYGNVKTEVDGITFMSKKEAARYSELKQLEKAGLITDLKLQPKFVLQEPFCKNAKHYRAITYVSDFCYKDTETGKTIVEDVKGRKTQVYSLKKKLFEYKYPELEIKEI